MAADPRDTKCQVSGIRSQRAAHLVSGLRANVPVGKS